MDIETLKDKISKIEIKDDSDKINESKTIKEIKMTNIYCEVVSENKRQKGILFSRSNFSFNDLNAWIDRNCCGCLGKEIIDDHTIKVTYDSYIKEEIYTYKRAKIKKCITLKNFEKNKENIQSYMKNLFNILSDDFDIVSINTYKDYNYSTVVREECNDFKLKVYALGKFETIKIHLEKIDIDIISIETFLEHLKEFKIKEVEILFANYHLINPEFRETLRPLYYNRNQIMEENMYTYISNLLKKIKKNFSKLKQVEIFDDESIKIFSETSRLVSHISKINPNNMETFKQSFDEEHRTTYYVRLKKRAFSDSVLKTGIDKLIKKLKKAGSNFSKIRKDRSNTQIIEEVLAEFISLSENKNGGKNNI